MADDNVPTVDKAVESIVSQLKQMREAGATVPQQQGYLKSQLLSNKVVFPQNRNEALKKVNHGIGTNWSMTKVKQADHTPYVEAKPKPAPIPVDELHGSSAVSMAGSGVVIETTDGPKEVQDLVVGDQLADKGVTVKVIPDEEIPKDENGNNAEIVIPPTGLRRETLEERVVKRQQENLMGQLDEGDQYVSWNVSDTHIDHTVRLASGDIIVISMNAENQVIARVNLSQKQRHAQQEAAATETNTTQSNTEESNMQTQATNNIDTNAAEATAKDLNAMTDFVKMLTLKGASTPELRAAAFHWYLDNKAPQAKPGFDAFMAAQPAEAGVDQRLFSFLDADANKEFASSFMMWILAEYAPAVTEVSVAEAKSRWSLMGERDEGIRSSWIGAGAAVIGGGMEAFATGGGITVGSAIGTVAGAAAAFFAGELIDENVESQFGRYVVAGTLGLGLGAAGATLGRTLLPGNKLIGGSSNAVINGEVPTQILAPATSNMSLISGM